jgi:hypothetical protein
MIGASGPRIEGVAEMGTRRGDAEESDLDRIVGGLMRDADDDDIVPPEMAAVVEAGGGVAEGFELSERSLIEHAEDAPPDATRRLLSDAPGVEAEPDRAVYGEADHERSSEDDED